jgi:hypothetical protein
MVSTAMQGLWRDKSTAVAANPILKACIKTMVDKLVFLISRGW